MSDLPFIYRIAESDVPLLLCDRTYLSYICEHCGFERYGRRQVYGVDICLGCLKNIAANDSHLNHYCRARLEEMSTDIFFGLKSAFDVLESTEEYIRFYSPSASLARLAQFLLLARWAAVKDAGHSAYTGANGDGQ